MWWYRLKVQAPKNSVRSSLDTNQTDLYTRSILLMRYALEDILEGTQDNYQRLCQQMDPALQNSGRDPFTAWMLGRRLFAAHRMNDEMSIETTQAELSKCLEEIKISENKPSDFNLELNYAMYAWSYGYLAITQYSPEVKEKMLRCTQLLMQWCNTGAISADSKSHTMWSLVLNLQAAAFHQDKLTYYFILSQMKTLTNEQTISAALNAALTRTDASSDYPAWAISMVLASAALISDHDLYQELTETLNKSTAQATQWSQQYPLHHANQWKAQAEIELAHYTEKGINALHLATKHKL
jgi:hypothetical protein